LKEEEFNMERYIGIMSGTSLDGVDVVLCEIDELECRLLASIVYPILGNLKKDLLDMMSSNTSLKVIGEINYRLGVLFRDAVESLIEKWFIDIRTVRAIGLHGQTLWHSPDGAYPFSMQLGDANILTAKYSLPVVSDFRAKDIALGGQGAPFAPAFHAFLFSSTSKIAVVNIGGMANITVLDEKLIGYDIGCGNVLLDLWVHKHKDIPYDKDGEWAKSGRVNEALLRKMIDDAYFSQNYPKSTGREKFNMGWIESVLGSNEDGLSPVDIQRTLLELVALSISREVYKFRRDEVLLCGGGVKNTFLLERIGRLLGGVRLSISPHFDELEAMTFAWLAHERIHQKEVNLKDVTGASKNSILGAVYR
jgi:anhydro-N-acetylmuramic acid kinase